jgi:hypothetical protein
VTAENNRAAADSEKQLRADMPTDATEEELATARFPDHAVTEAIEGTVKRYVAAIDASHDVTDAPHRPGVDRWEDWLRDHDIHEALTQVPPMYEGNDL